MKKQSKQSKEELTISDLAVMIAAVGTSVDQLAIATSNSFERAENRLGRVETRLDSVEVKLNDLEKELGTVKSIAFKTRSHILNLDQRFVTRSEFEQLEFK